MNKYFGYILSAFGLLCTIVFSWMLFDMLEARGLGLTMGIQSHANTDNGAIALMSILIVMSLIITFTFNIIERLNK